MTNTNPRLYQLQHETFQFNKLKVKMQSVQNRDEVYSHLLNKDADDEDVKDERIPYWVEIWPASIALSTHLATNIDAVRGKRLIEIGSGLGLCGLTSALLGARVTITDYLADALHFARENAKLNELKNVEFMQVDWRNCGHLPEYEVVLASDVVYESKAHEPLLNALKQLTAANGKILLSEPGRQQSEPFTEKLRKAFPLVKTFTYPVLRNDFTFACKVYEITR